MPGITFDTRNASSEEGDAACAPTEPDPALWLRSPSFAFARWQRAKRVRTGELESHSIEQYVSMWGRWCAFMAARGIDVSGTRGHHVESFLANLRGGRLQDRPAAPSTRRRYLFLLDRTFMHLEILGIAAENPCAGMPELARHQALERPARALLTRTQEENFIRWSLEQGRCATRWEQTRDCALRLLFLASGVTVAEARSLRIQDVQIDAEQSALLEIAAHGEIPARSAPVAYFAVTALRSWLRVRAEAGASGAPGTPLFNTRRLLPEINPHRAQPAPAPLSPEEIYEIVCTALRACGYQRSRSGPATLRNTFLARQIRQGVPLERIRDWAGLRTVEQLRALAKQVPIRDDGMVVA